LFTSITFAQQKTITGKVMGEKDKQPIFGATVAVKGSNVATQTGADGSFTITVPNPNSVLVITFVGFETIEIPLAGKSNVEISMKDKSTTLTDVVVTGYSSQAKKDITGSVAVVKTEDLKSIPAANAETQLQGRASGVTVITNNRPGDGASVRIRGFASFGGNEPLVVIDGIPGSLTSINPNDIESMQVLKDAASASVYGSRASNGVIIVTTKKGKQGSAKVTYNMYYGASFPGKGYTNLLNPQEMADLAWLAKKNQGLPLTHDQYGSGPNPRLPDYILAGTKSGVMEGDPAANPALYNLNLDNVSGSYLIVRANKAGTNWFKEITETAPIQNHNINVSGGSDRSRYLFGFDLFDQKGIVIHNFFKRYTARVNTEFNIKKNIRIGQNLQISASQGNGAGLNDEGTEIANSYRAQPIVPVFNINGDFAGSRGANLGNGNNPYATRVRSKDNRGNNYSVFGNMYAEVDFLKHFTARTSFGGTFSNDNYYFYTFQTYENAENNSGTSFTEGVNYFRSWTWTNQLTYKNTFGAHDVTVVGGSEAIEEWGRAIQGLRLGYFVDNVDFRSLDAGGASGQRASGSPYTPAALFSIFGKADYAYNNKYLASFTIRRDGSSRFGANNRYGVFPAFSVGWRISEETFMQDIKWLTDLKLRGSWGQMGNQRILPANSFSQYASGPGSSNYDINGNQNSTVGGFQLSFVGNPDGKWETNTTTNIGFDATLFGGKTEIVAEWYSKKTDDLLFRLEQVATAGAGPSSNPPFVNVASMKNTGLDLLINQRMNIGGNNGVKLDATLTFTTYQNEITKIADGVDFFDAVGAAGRVGGTFFRNAVGNSVSAFYGFKVIGLFQSADDVAKSPTQEAAAPGRFKYLDANGDGAITDDDRVFFGNPNPDFTYGINLNASYKNFDLGVFFYGAEGKDVINYVRWWTDFVPSFQGAKSKDALYNSWTPQRPNAKVPIQEESGNRSTNGAPNSYYMEDGSFLRMKNLSLGYSLPSSLLNRFKVDRLRLYVQATNLFTITKYTGLDPEVTGGDTEFGVDAGNYPTVKQFFIGVNLGF
jgi:TonB-linked SusC/RagA family outer membrane protein